MKLRIYENNIVAHYTIQFNKEDIAYLNELNVNIKKNGSVIIPLLDVEGVEL